MLLAFLGGFYLLAGSGKANPYHEHVPSGNPPVVIVTVLDPNTFSTTYLDTIRDNRKSYAEKHGMSLQRIHPTLGAKVEGRKED